MKQIVPCNNIILVLLILLLGLKAQAQSVGIPTITSFSPTAAATGQTVTIKGSNFTGATSVYFGAYGNLRTGTPSVSYTVVNDNTITAIVGAGQSGSISVTNSKGIVYSSTAFVYVVQPNITSISTSHQTIGGAVKIYGSGFQSATDIKIGGVSVLYFPHYAFIYANQGNQYLTPYDTEMTIFIGNNNNSGDISITNPLGTATISGFTVDAQPNNIWTGGLSDDFSLAANWSNGVLPAPHATITIPYGTCYSPIIYRDTTLYKIQLEGNISTNTSPAKATLTLKDSVFGYGYFMYGSIIVDGNIGLPITEFILDDITIKSGTVTFNTENYYIFHNNPMNLSQFENYAGGFGGAVRNFTINGGTVNILKGRNFFQTMRVYGRFSSNGGTINTNNCLDIGDASNEIVVSYPITGNINGKVGVIINIPQYNAPALRDLSVPVTGAAVGNFSSQTYSYSNGIWSSKLASNTLLVPGTGYRAKIDSFYIKSTGFLVKSSVSPPITQGANAFSFVANPYVSQLDFEKITTTNLQSGYWYLDPSNVVSGYQSYKYYGTLTGASNTFSDGISPTKYIQSGQGFFVQNQNNNSASSLTFSISAIDNSQPKYNVFGTSAPLNRITTGLFKDGKNVDGAVAVFNSSFSGDFDQYDGVKFSNNGENLTFKVGSKDLCANAWSMPKPADVLQMHLYNLVKGTTYSLKLNASQFVGYGVKAYLKDNLLQTQTLLTDSNTISFSADSANYTSRFSIVFGENPLSVKCITLSATQSSNKQATINWSVVGANSVSNYQVERSVDCINFTTLTIVNAGSSSNFSFQDATATDGVYYRIKATDNIGMVSYSNVVKLTTTDAHLSTFAVYPNPVTNNTITYTLPAVGKYTLNIINSVGKVVYNANVNHTSASGMERIQLVNKLAAGSYTFRATDANGKLVTTQVIIN